MRILSYGEDGLTIWMLMQRQEELFHKIGIAFNPDDCISLYRPSFGRGHNCFGEFDAIIITPNTVYLIESKWIEASDEINTGIINDTQQLRHLILRQYINEWYALPPNERILQNLNAQNINHVIPNTNQRLYKHLMAFLNILSNHCNTLPDIRDIHLIFNKTYPLARLVTPQGFERIVMNYDNCDRDKLNEEHYIML